MLKSYGVIYIIKNKSNGKTYIGQTTGRVQARWNAHKRNNTMIIGKALNRIIQKGFIFSYANQSGSTEIKNSEHAQRLEGETVNAEYNPSTSPQFPIKYLENKETILELSKKITAHAISKKLNLDKSMLCYFIHCFREKR